MKFVLVAAVAGLLFATATAAHVGTTLYPIYELPTSRLPDLHDGSLADWEEALPGATVDFREFVSLAGVGDSAPISADDLAYRFFLAWHGATGRLYLACERIDDVYVNTYDGTPSDIWRYDGIELMVDGDHSGGAYAATEANKELWHVQAQQYLALPEAPSGNQLVTLSLFSPWPWEQRAWVFQPPYADIGGYVIEGTPTVQYIELYVTPFDELRFQDPAASRPSLLASDRVIGFSLSVPDFDAKPGDYRAFHTLAGQSETWRYAERFVDGLLVGCDVEDCGAAPAPVSAVAADSWGRIKASFLSPR